MQPSEKPKPPQGREIMAWSRCLRIRSPPCWDLVPACARARLLSGSLSVPSVGPYFPGPVHPLETFGFGIITVFCLRYINQLIELYILFFQYICVLSPVQYQGLCVLGIQL